MVKQTTWLIALVALSTLSACGGEQSPEAHDVQIEKRLELVGEPVVDRPVTLKLYRDTYGVPHVFSDSNYGVYFGFGYAVAQDRLFQMEMLKRTAQGRVAEVLGAKYLELDKKLRSQYDHKLVEYQVQSLSPRDHDILAGYAAGMNAYLEELAQSGAMATDLPKPFYDFDFQPSRWTAFDVASIFVGSIAHRYADFNSERDNLAFLNAMEVRHGKEKAWQLFNAAKWLRDNTSPTTVPAQSNVDVAHTARPAYLDEQPSAPLSVAHIVFDAVGGFTGLSDGSPELAAMFNSQLAKNGFESHAEYSPASNYWAMTGLKDARAALLNGPQFDFAMPSYVYAIGLHGGDFDVVGNTLLALPSLLFAHNNQIAWGSTAGISDLTDEYWLTLNPDNPNQYRYGGEWRDFELVEQRIKVRDQQDTVATARRAAQGMVQSWDPETGVAWVRARAWEGLAVQDLLTWVWLATDTTIEQAEQRIAGKSTNINMYTMDKTGRLGYVHSGKYPQRHSDHDPRLPAPGDGRFDWQGLRPYDDNPKVKDPEQGYIVNWNNRPANNWISSDLWPYTWSRADRVHILIDELEAMKGGTVADLVAINTRSTFEDVNHRYLLPLLNTAISESAATDGTREAIALLNDWDKYWQADGSAQFGPANALMEAFLRHLNRQVFLDDVGEEYFHLFAATNYPNNSLGASLGTPVGVRSFIKYVDDLTAPQGPSYDWLNGETVNEVVLESFLLAIEELTQAQGRDMANWRLDAAPMVWQPFNFRGVPQASLENTVSVTTYQNRGTENNVFVATGAGIEARDVNPPGQGGHLAADGSPQKAYTDQMKLYTNFNYKSLPFSETAVKSAATEIIELSLRP